MSSGFGFQEMTVILMRDVSRLQWAEEKMRGKASLRKVSQKKGESHDSSQRTTQTHFKVVKTETCLQTPGGKELIEEGSGCLDMGFTWAFSGAKGPE